MSSKRRARDKVRLGMNRSTQFKFSQHRDRLSLTNTPTVLLFTQPVDKVRVWWPPTKDKERWVQAPSCSAWFVLSLLLRAQSHPGVFCCAGLGTPEPIGEMGAGWQFVLGCCGDCSQLLSNCTPKIVLTIAIDLERTPGRCLPCQAILISAAAAVLCRVFPQAGHGAQQGP